MKDEVLFWRLLPRAPREKRHDEVKWRTSRAHLRWAIFALFAASRFAGLIYESLWTQYLKLFLGHAAYAQTLVLAIFMGGMAIGSFISSRRYDSAYQRHDPRLRPPPKRCLISRLRRELRAD